MREVLRNPTFRTLYAAQIVALLGTGLLTVALGLLAFQLAGADASLVLGIALTIKMVAYVVLGPVLSALTAGIARKPLLIGADVVRVAVALLLPFVSEAWHIYVLILVLQAASAAFTPAFQAVIPEVLPDERDYTRALSLSRLAYDLEALVSPMLAAALLTVVAPAQLFLGTAAGFAGSALLVFAAALPHVDASAARGGFLERLTRGVRVFVGQVELRALLALNLVVAAPTAFVIVDSVVLVQGELGSSERAVALLLAAYGVGSMLVALLLPRWLEHRSERSIMLAAGGGCVAALCCAAGALGYWGDDAWPALFVEWIVLGGSTAAILTAAPRLLRRHASAGELPSVFAAQFALSHACFLVTYPLAGVLGSMLGVAGTALVMAGIAFIALVVATRLWVHRDETTPVAAGGA